MGRRGPRPTKAAAISRAALALLAERGVRGATMRAIARRAHTTEGNLYRYYPNKRELVGHVLGGCLRDFGEHLTLALEGVTEPAEALALFVRTYLEYSRRLPLEGRAMFEVEDTGGNGTPNGTVYAEPNGVAAPAPIAMPESVATETAEPTKPVPRRVLVKVLQDGMDRGSFPKTDAERLASFILGGLAEVTGPCAHGPDAVAPDHSEELVQLVLRLVGVSD